jgi:hypothetical protein
MAITGLALIGFVVTHLLGNLFLYQSSGEGFNAYAAKLQSLGALLEIAVRRLRRTPRLACPLRHGVILRRGRANPVRPLSLLRGLHADPKRHHRHQAGRDRRGLPRVHG